MFDMCGFSYNELFNLAVSKPMMAQIKLTDNCEQNCIFCMASCDSKKQAIDMPAKNWFKILLKLKNLGVSKLNFTGGEVFLYSEVAKVFAFAKEQGFVISPSSDGLTSVVKFKGYIDEISFSVHGTGEIHDNVVSCEGSFEKVAKHIQEAINLGIRVSLNTVLAKDNYNYFEDVYDYFKDLGISFHSFPIAINAISGIDCGSQILDLDRGLFLDYLDKLRKMLPERLSCKHGLGVIMQNNPEYYQETRVPLPDCAGGKYKLVIEADGSVYPCNFFRTQNYYCGNILYDNEFEIWRKGRGFQSFRRLILEEKIPSKCRSCIKKYKCFSGCRAWIQNYRQGGFYNEADLRCELGNAYVGT
ncbi:MAG: radical SAM protein [bacterium]